MAGVPVDGRSGSAAVASSSVDVCHSQLAQASSARDYREVYRCLSNLAIEGHAESQVLLARLYDEGLGVEKNLEKAFQWYEKSFENGHSEGALAVGWFYEKGEIVDRDLQEAMKMYEFSAAAGNVSAQYNIGVMFAKGRGVQQDYKKAKLWYERAARNGHMLANVNLGNLYLTGRGVERDLAEAKRYYEVAAIGGHALGEFHLGMIFAKGLGNEADLGMATYWLGKAAEQGLMEARELLDEVEWRMRDEAIARCFFVYSSVMEGAEKIGEPAQEIGRASMSRLAFVVRLMGERRGDVRFDDVFEGRLEENRNEAERLERRFLEGWKYDDKVSLGVVEEELRWCDEALTVR